ncbi:hypothetical protein R1flu_029070 [Riccia fluitans]|uniref:SET domain-containing protein n=1 Tax=Riccia fluitans TaxID=41844 RepID=A0ABD1XNK2_9MARC
MDFSLLLRMNLLDNPHLLSLELAGGKDRDVNVRELAERIQCRLDETSGKYNVLGMMKEAGAMKIPYLDHAEYLGPIRVADKQGKGIRRGLVATKKIAAGTLILCRKAWAIVFEEERKVARDIDTEDHLVLRILEKLQREGITAEELYSRIYGGASMPPVLPAESRILFSESDMDRIGFIVRYSCFQVPRLTELSDSKAMRETIGRGLWILPSFVNHSCVANAIHNILGDTMFIRAVRDIDEGEEIFLSYVDPLHNFLERTSKLEERGFRCRCSLCSFERGHPDLDVNGFRSGIARQLEQIGLSDLELKAGQVEQEVDPLLDLFACVRYTSGTWALGRSISLAWKLRCFYKLLGRQNETKKWAKRTQIVFEAVFGEGELWQNLTEDYKLNALTPLPPDPSEITTFNHSLVSLLYRGGFIVS